MKKLHQRLAKNQAGATMVEYALMVALIAVVAIVAVTYVGQKVDSKFDMVCKKLNNDVDCPQE